MFFIKFDGFLYGNGLTEYLVSKCNSVERFNEYLKRFLGFEEHKKEKRIFYNILESTNSSNVYLTKKEIYMCEDFLAQNINLILDNGFELCALNFPNYPMGDIALYYYALYNFWYNNTFDLVISSLDDEIKLIVKKIFNYKINEEKIYTTNFDKYFDRYVKVKHVHGEFVNNLNNAKQLHGGMLSEKKFIYKFIFGSNFNEKLNYLENIDRDANNIDSSFLFSNDIYFDNLLIYGLRFAESTVFENDCFDKSYIKSADSHILLRLYELYKNNRLSKVTVTYYTEKDKENLSREFKKYNFFSIVEFIHSTKIF